MARARRLATMLAAASLILSACGGSSSGTAASPSAPPPPPPGPPPLSSDASLSALATSDGQLDPAFSPAQLQYAISVAAAIDSVTVTPTAADANASVTVDNTPVTSGMASGPLAMQLGDNTVSIAVTAEDGVTVRNYALDVRRMNNDAMLTDLSASTGGFDQAFQSTNYDYSTSVSFGEDNVMVTAELSDPNATMLIDSVAATSGVPAGPIQLNEGPNTISVDVTSEDGTVTNTYNIQMTRQLAGDFAQTAYVKGSFNQARDYFGSAAAIQGDTMVIGAYGEDSSSLGINGDRASNGASQSGAVFVFTRDAAGTWFEDTFIKSSNSDAGDEFGRALALDGDTLVVATYSESSASAGVNGDQTDNSLRNVGAAYVFVRDGMGAWSQQAYLKASNPSEDDWFGGAWSLGLSGDTLAVPAINEDTTAIDSGAVYVFTRDGAGNWTEDVMLKASDASAGAQFGVSVDLEGDTLVVGSVRGLSGNGGGAVYVYTRDGLGNWAETQILTASNGEIDDTFGSDVAISGDTIAVTAAGESSAAQGINGDQADNSAPDSGAAYIFERDGLGVWTQTAYIKASNSQAGDNFATLDLEGDLLVVASRLEDSSATGVNGNESDNVLESAGAAYVFVRDQNGTWTQRSYIKASNPNNNDQFFNPETDGSTIVLRAVGEDSAATGINGDQTDNSALWAGAVYVYE